MFPPQINAVTRLRSRRDTVFLVRESKLPPWRQFLLSRFHGEDVILMRIRARLSRTAFEASRKQPPGIARFGSGPVSCDPPACAPMLFGYFGYPSLPRCISFCYSSRNETEGLWSVLLCDKLWDFIATPVLISTENERVCRYYMLVAGL